jgi:CheY-like chemotaxis protein
MLTAKLNGYEVAKILRARAGGDRLLLIALTGWGQEQDRQRAAAAGFDRHLTKPVDPELIFKLLSESATVD